MQTLRCLSQQCHLSGCQVPGVHCWSQALAEQICHLICAAAHAVPDSLTAADALESSYQPAGPCALLLQCLAWHSQAETCVLLQNARAGHLVQLTFLRMGDLMFDNWDAFTQFLQRLHAPPSDKWSPC